jgi:hypothetical protein
MTWVCTDRKRRSDISCLIPVLVSLLRSGLVNGMPHCCSACLLSQRATEHASGDRSGEGGTWTETMIWRKAAMEATLTAQLRRRTKTVVQPPDITCVRTCLSSVPCFAPPQGNRSKAAVTAAMNQQRIGCGSIGSISVSSPHCMRTEYLSEQLWNALRAR